MVVALEPFVKVPSPPPVIDITGRKRLIRSHSSAIFLLRIKWKFELTVHFKHEMLGK